MLLARQRPDGLSATPDDLHGLVLLLCGSADRLCAFSGSDDFALSSAGAHIMYRSYDGMYHELHNDLGREQVLADSSEWIVSGATRHG